MTTDWHAQDFSKMKDNEAMIKLAFTLPSIKRSCCDVRKSLFTDPEVMSTLKIILMYTLQPGK